MSLPHWTTNAGVPRYPCRILWKKTWGKRRPRYLPRSKIVPGGVVSVFPTLVLPDSNCPRRERKQSQSWSQEQQPPKIDSKEFQLWVHRAIISPRYLLGVMLACFHVPTYKYHLRKGAPPWLVCHWKILAALHNDILMNAIFVESSGLIHCISYWTKGGNQIWNNGVCA